MTVALPDPSVPMVNSDGRVHHHWYPILKTWVDEFNRGVAKAWGLVTVSAGSPTLTSGYNVSSITDNGAGDFSPVFSTPLTNANYAPVVTLQTATGNRVLTALVTSKTTTGFRVVILEEGSTAGSVPAAIDNISFAFAVYGAST